jgi:hypothetical protein
MKKIIIVLIAGCLTITGCKKDEPEIIENTETNTGGSTTGGGSTGGGTTAVTTVQQDKDNIKSSLSGIVGCMQSFRSGEFVSAFNNFFEFSDAELMNEDWIEDLVVGLENHIDLDYVESTSRLDLARHYGTYTYNVNSKSWSKVTGSGSSVVFIFPSSANSSSSDMVATLSNYSDQMVTLDNENIYIPTSASIKLSKNGTEIAHIILNKASYDFAGDIPMPTLVDLSVKMAPFTYKLDYERNTPTQFIFNLDVSSTSSCGYTINSKLNLTHSDYENIDAENDIESVEINFEYPGALSVNSTIDVNGISALGDDPTASQLNSKIDAIVSYNKVKIGELELQKTGDETQVFIRHKNNMTENVNIYTDVFFSDLENVFFDMTGGW